MAAILQDRVAVVTGAGNGIGRAEAMALAAAGASVIVNDIGTSVDGQGASTVPADSVAAAIRDAGGKAFSDSHSVTEEEGAKAIIQSALTHFGRLDILINNAGVIRNRPVFEINTADWDLVVKTHLYGTFYCTRAASIIMRQQGYGRIVNTSSHIGLGFVGQSTYSAAKEGIVGFSRSVARDLGPFGATCNVIRPLAAWRGAAEKDDRMEANRPEDIAPLVVYLASEGAGNVNGCIFEVWKGHIGLYSDPPPVEQVIWKDGSWTVEELTRVMPSTLTQNKSRENFPPTMSFKFGRQSRD